MTTLLFVLALLSKSTVGLDNGVAITPPMGWNPYNAYSCATSENDYRVTAQALVNLGLKDLGYKYFSLDCGWQATVRSSDGQFMWDSSKIPSGIPALAEFVHGLGLSFGVYSDAGFYSCDDVNGASHRIGSQGYEQSDAMTFAGWGADYLKYDNCYAVSKSDFADQNPSIKEEPLYTTMRDALNSTGRKVVFSLCEWGLQDPARWAAPVGNSWRMSNDIGPPPTFASIRRIINQLVPITQFAGPGRWNDLDILEVGNAGMTEAEWKAHFAFWAAAKSPLIISTNLLNITDNVRGILSNKQLIAINQDSLGRSIDFKRRYTDDYDVWAGPLADGSTVAVLLNWKNTQQQIAFNLSDVGFVSASLTDLSTDITIGSVIGSHTAAVDAHGALVYKLTNGVSTAPRSFTTYLASAPSTVLAGGASLRTVNSTESVAGFIGQGGSVTFVGVDGGNTGGTKLLSLSYINADFTFSNTACPNCRRAEVRVNGGNPVVVEMPLSGESWDILYEGYLVSLGGFLPGQSNQVMFGSSDGWAPDMYSIGIQV